MNRKAKDFFCRGMFFTFDVICDITMYDYL